MMNLMEVINELVRTKMAHSTRSQYENVFGMKLLNKANLRAIRERDADEAAVAMQHRMQVVRESLAGAAS